MNVSFFSFKSSKTHAMMFLLDESWSIVFLATFERLWRGALRERFVSLSVLICSKNIYQSRG